MGNNLSHENSAISGNKNRKSEIKGWLISLAVAVTIALIPIALIHL